MITPADMDTLLEIGESLLAQGDARGSLKLFDSVLTGIPTSVPALLGSAAALVQLGAPEQAYRYVDLAINVAPDDAAVWRTATSVALAAGDGPMAERVAKRRLELAGDGIDGLMDLALAALFALDYHLARDAAAEAVRVAPDDDAARLWNERLAAIRSEHDLLIEAGRAHCRRGRFGRGLELFDRALGIADSYDAHLYAGRALLALGAPAAATEQLEAALRLAPGDAEATADLALAREMMGPEVGPAPDPTPPAGPRSAVTPPAPTEPTPAPPQLFCTSCGTRLLAGAAFCVKCGASTR